MKARSCIRPTLALLAVLVLVGIAATPVHALTVNCPNDKTGECDSWFFDKPTATNACCTNITITITGNQSNVTTCVSTYTRFWQVADCCTKYSCSQTVTVKDTTPPVITCASNKPVQCGTAWHFDPPMAFDACCGTNVTVSLVGSNLVSATSCQQVWAGLWQAVDCCTNYSAICTQLVFIAAAAS